MLFDGILAMVGNHEDRVIDRYEKDNLIIDTCFVNDGIKPIETAISHPLYKNSEWVIVELYGNGKDAKIGHLRWINIMIHELPECLEDYNNTLILGRMKKQKHYKQYGTASTPK